MPTVCYLPLVDYWLPVLPLLLTREKLFYVFFIFMDFFFADFMFLMGFEIWVIKERRKKKIIKLTYK